MLTHRIPQNSHFCSDNLSIALDLAYWQAEYHRERASLALSDAVLEIARMLDAEQELRRLERQIPV